MKNLKNLKKFKNLKNSELFEKNLKILEKLKILKNFCCANNKQKILSLLFPRCSNVKPICQLKAFVRYFFIGNTHSSQILTRKK